MTREQTIWVMKV